MKVFCKKVLSCLVVFSIVFLASCKHDKKDGGQDQEGNSSFVVNFSSNENILLKAMKEDNTSIESGEKVAKDTVIIFTAEAKVKDEYLVGEWTCQGGAFEEGTGKTKDKTAKVKVNANITVSVDATKIPEFLDMNANNVSFKMVKIPKTKLARIGVEGSTPQPLRYVSLSSFYLCETEVTQELYEAVMSVNPSYSRDDPAPDGEDGKKRPVETVSWFDAVRFCNALTTMLMSSEDCVYSIEGEGAETKVGLVLNVGEAPWKKGFRLPSEAEWEWAARGGYYQAPQYAGPLLSEEELNMDGLTDEEKKAKYLELAAKVKEEVKEYAWLTTNAGRVPHQVKMKKPNPYKLYDMSGNVYEWCYDTFSVDFPEYIDYIRIGQPLPSDVIVEVDPMGGKEGDTQIVKGGSFYAPAPPIEPLWISHGECSYRAGTSPHGTQKFIGFRVACGLQD